MFYKHLNRLRADRPPFEIRQFDGTDDNAKALCTWANTLEPIMARRAEFLRLPFGSPDGAPSNINLAQRSDSNISLEVGEFLAYENGSFYKITEAEMSRSLVLVSP